MYKIEKGQTMPREMVAELLAVFEERRKNVYGAFGTPAQKKRIINAQMEFMLGASAAIDSMVGNDKMTCISPIVVFGVMAGEYLTMEKEEIK